LDSFVIFVYIYNKDYVTAVTFSEFLIVM